jgi:hypothetical protein
MSRSSSGNGLAYPVIGVLFPVPGSHLLNPMPKCPIPQSENVLVPLRYPTYPFILPLPILWPCKDSPSLPPQILQHAPQSLHRHWFRQKQVYTTTKRFLPGIRVRCSGQRDKRYGLQAVLFLEASDVACGLDA